MIGFIRFLIILLLFLSFPLNESGAEEILAWEDCVEEAGKNHPDLISSGETLNQARISRNITRAAFFPQISSSLSGGTSGTDENEKTESYSYSISGRQLLFDGFRTSNNLAAALENVKSAEYDYEITSANVRLKLRNAFIALFRAQELLLIAEDIAGRRKENAELVNLRYEGGREHRGSFLNAQANLAQAQFEVAQAGRNIGLAQRRLAKELGRRKLNPIRAEGSFEIPHFPREKPDFASLAEATPFLKRLASRKEIAGFNLKSARADFFPRISASTSAGKSSSEWPLADEDTHWSLGVSLSFPLFEGWSRIAEVERKKAALSQVRENERSGRDSISLTLEETWVNFQNAIEIVGVRERFLAASIERATIAEAQYSQGLISFDNWIIIEDDLVRAKKSFLDVRANALVAKANWIQAQGGTLDYEE